MTAATFADAIHPDADTSQDRHPDPQRIVILGGGFGGLYTALRLDELPWTGANPVEIVLVDRADRFTFLPLLYELMTGELQTWEVAPPLTEVLANTQVRFVQAEVTGIDVTGQQVQLRSVGRDRGELLPLRYDRLVLAVGGETPLDIVPGAADHAFPFRTVEDASRLGERLRSLEAADTDKIRVAVVGGGYSGVEIACKLADRLGDRGRLRLIEQGDQILANSPEFNRRAADRALQERGIWIDWETTVRQVDADRLTLDYRGETEEIHVDAVVWTVGNRVPQWVQTLPLARSDRGQISVLPTLQTTDHPHIFALGDLADCRDATGQAIPTTAQAAFQQADYAGWNLWASLGDRPLLPFRYQPLGEMLALGNTSATFTGLGMQLDGPLAYVARRLVYLSRMPSLEHQLKVGMNWLTQPLLDLLPR
jgi:NADH dehydrogenase